MPVVPHVLLPSANFRFIAHVEKSDSYIIIFTEQLKHMRSRKCEQRVNERQEVYVVNSLVNVRLYIICAELRHYIISTSDMSSSRQHFAFTLMPTPCYCFLNSQQKP